MLCCPCCAACLDSAVEEIGYDGNEEERPEFRLIHVMSMFVV